MTGQDAPPDPRAPRRGYKEFEFDLPGALLTELFKTFSALHSEHLTADTALTIPNEQGVYQLFYQGQLVYIGKTDAESGLRQRLERHAFKVQHRRNLDPGQVEFKAVRIFVFTAVDLEAGLLKHYERTRKVLWNGSGFGSNDPGRERDTTVVKEDNYDALYPIDIDRPLVIAFKSEQTAAQAFNALKNAVPYTVRTQGAGGRSRQPHADLTTTNVTVLAAPSSTRNIVKQITRQLPTGWQATALPGYVILYKEARDYPHGVIVARS